MAGGERYALSKALCWSWRSMWIPVSERMRVEACPRRLYRSPGLDLNYALSQEGGTSLLAGESMKAFQVGRGARDLLCGGEWDGERERRALPGHALHGDGTTLHLHQTLRDG